MWALFTPAMLLHSSCFRPVASFARVIAADWYIDLCFHCNFGGYRCGTEERQATFIFAV